MTLDHISAVWTGLPGDTASVLWAALWAERTGRRLRILHLGHRRGAATDRPPLAMNNLLRELTRVHPCLQVEGLVLDSDPIGLLVTESRTADLLVIAAPRSSATGTPQLAGIAFSPVVVVPQTWSGYSDLAQLRVVTTLNAGVAGHAAIRCAAREADLIHAPLELVTVEWAGSTSTREARAYAALISGAHPGLRAVASQGIAQHPADLLPAAGENALLVMGCHHAADPGGGRLGRATSRGYAAATVPVVFAGRCPARPFLTGIPSAGPLPADREILVLAATS